MEISNSTIRGAFSETIKGCAGDFAFINELEAVKYGQKAIAVAVLTGRDFRDSLSCIVATGIYQVTILVPVPNNNDGEPDKSKCITELESKADEILKAVKSSNKKYLDEATLPYLSQVMPYNDTHYALILSITYEMKR